MFTLTEIGRRTAEAGTFDLDGSAADAFGVTELGRDGLADDTPLPFIFEAEDDERTTTAFAESTTLFLSCGSTGFRSICCLLNHIDISDTQQRFNLPLPVKTFERADG